MIHSGIARQRWIDPLDNFVRDHGRQTPRWAIICTYGCDPDVLERQVLPRLNRRGRAFRTLVLADAGELEVQLAGKSTFRPRNQVNLHPVRVRGGGIFHPKIVFLRAGAHARVCFGSANISVDGFGGNLELWTYSDDPEIVGAFTRLFLQLGTHPNIQIDPVFQRQVERAVIGLPNRASASVWSSLDESFKKRIASRHRAHASPVVVVSPLFAAGEGIGRARSVFASSKATVYTDDAVTIPRASTRCYMPPNAIDSDEGDQPDYPSTLHAKLYVLERPTGAADAWVGSANFTAQALTKSVREGGNVECMVHTVIPRDELQAIRAELDGLFEKPERTNVAASRVSKTSTTRSTVLACELQRAPSGFRLVVYVIPGTASVTLEHHGLSVKISTVGDVGVLHGKKLLKVFSDLNAECPQLYVIYQIVGKVRIPVVVNSPYVSEMKDELSHASLDEMLDELRGYIPKPRGGDEIDLSDDDEPEDESEPEVDPAVADSERRLDEVKHQGLLDQLAVKVTIARRLIQRETEPGSLREELFVLMRRSCEVACPPALWPVLKNWLSK